MCIRDSRCPISRSRPRSIVERKASRQEVSDFKRSSIDRALVRHRDRERHIITRDNHRSLTNSKHLDQCKVEHLDATTFDVTDFLPAGFTLNDAAWTASANGTTATFTGGPLDAGDSVDITITMTAGTATGDFVNWAEISSDSGDDIDSTPDANQGNDNQPAAPGDPTDNVTDNTAGDEDDHDPAPITVEVFDLALIKVLAVGQAPVIIPGDDVTFTITVTNQGTIDAGTFEVTDFLPAGFTLNDAAWTAGAGNTATYTGGPLAAGASTTVDITMTADANITPGDFVNWAEISSDDGDDIDSITDDIVANDNQPAAPGDPTDNVVDNTAGDEDDHDPAPISVEPTPVFDLALIKVLAAGQASVIEPGDDVTFTITVENQGCLLYTSPSPRDATLSRMPSSA